MILPTNRQIQIVAEILSDPAAAPEIDRTKLGDPWREFYSWIQDWIREDPQDIDPGKLRSDLISSLGKYGQTPIDGFDDYYSLIVQAKKTPLTYPSVYQIIDQIGDLEWLWKGWLLRGVPSMLAGVPGTGKSYLALDLARRIITGTEYPDGQSVHARGPVLYVDAENTPMIHKTRLAVWPRSLLHDLYMMFPTPDRFVINLDDIADREHLCDMAWFINPILIIIDSYGSCTLKGENNKEDVQGLLAYFNRIAQEFNCGLLVIHHLRKAVNTGQASFEPMSVDSIRGSSHIAATARHIWGLQFVAAGPEPGLNDPRRLWVMKSNVGASPDPLGVTFGPHSDNQEVAQLSYGDAPQPYKEVTRVDDCAERIVNRLVDAGEPVKPSHLLQQAKEQSYNSSLIYRARKRLGDRIVDTEQSYRHPRNSWALAEWLKDGFEPRRH